ncbi:MAG: hypothetical protein FWE15_04690 [Actinomycetia bacterium]|nr:hypothetical protein [Actinomycetes bacterium]
MTAARRDRAGYMRAYRARRPGYTERERLRSAARARALRDLARLHPADYQRLLASHLPRAAGQEEP